MPQPKISNNADAVGRKLTDGFFSRHGFSPTEARHLCWDFVKTTFEHEPTIIREAPTQGFCSYTLCLEASPQTILQFRPLVHKLDLDTINTAREIYGELVPRTELIGGLVIRKGKHFTKPLADSLSTNKITSDRKSVNENTTAPSLLVYSLSRIQGISLAELNSNLCSHTLGRHQHHHRASLIKSFAQIIARGLSSSYAGSCAPRGRIGSSIRHRLEIMRRDLPPRFRPTVNTLLDALPQIETLPWVLTHGDLVPSNIMVDFCPEPEPTPVSDFKSHCSCSPPSSLMKGGPPVISGLIDWAEAEYFPFGVGAYGLEEFLGIQVPIDGDGIDLFLPPLPTPTSSSPSASASNEPGRKYPPPRSNFQYFPDAESLRSLFWTELEKRIRVHFPATPLGSPLPSQKEDESPKLNLNPDPNPSPNQDHGSVPSSVPSALISNEKKSLYKWPEFLETVKLARTLGILLWHGIAFDDGRLDRVVCEGRDDEEIQRLDMHLFCSEERN